MSCPINTEFVHSPDTTLLGLAAALIAARTDFLRARADDDDYAMRRHSETAVEICHLAQRLYGTFPLMTMLGRESSATFGMVKDEVTFGDVVFFKDSGVWAWRYVGNRGGPDADMAQATRLVVQAASFRELPANPALAAAEDRALISAWFEEATTADYPCALASSMATVIAALQLQVLESLGVFE